MLQIRCFGPDGRMTRSEWFETDREAAALARFEELIGRLARHGTGRP